MISIQKILDDNFGGLEEAMEGHTELAHFYKSLVGIAMQQYALEVLEKLESGVDIEKCKDIIEAEEWS